MAVEVVIFDYARRGNTIEIAQEQALRSGFTPELFTNPAGGGLSRRLH